MEMAAAVGLDFHVGSEGSIRSTIAVIAEAPGPREVERGAPLIGGAGRLLWNPYYPRIKPIGALDAKQIGREDCYITNVVKRQVAQASRPGADARIPVSSHEIDQWGEILKWELSQLRNLRYVLICGAPALHAVLGLNRVSERRGSVIVRNGIHYVVTVNPANVLRHPVLESLFRFDCGKLRRVIDGRWRPPVIKAHINPSPDDALKWIAKLRRERKPVSLDIETMGHETACIGLANSVSEGMSISFRTITRNVWSLADEHRVRLAIQALISDPHVPLVMQKGNFDTYWMWTHDRIAVRKPWFDTMVAHHVLYPMLPHNLGHLTTQYTDHPWYKDELDSWKEVGDIDKFFEYNVKDCCNTLAVSEAEKRELARVKLDKFHADESLLDPILAQMTVNGIAIDHKMKAKLRDEMDVIVENIEKQFYRLVRTVTKEPDYMPNPGSAKAMGELLFDRLGLVGRGKATDDENLDRIIAHPRTQPKVRELVQITKKVREERKFRSTYAKAREDADGRFRCEWKITGTIKAPGRLSSSKTIWGSGMNMQNQPKRIAPTFICDGGYVYVYFDLSQAEARIVAWEWDVKALKENFKRALKDKSFDVHRGNAARIFRVPYDTIPKIDREKDGTPTRRFLGKRCVHGLNYRMGPDKLAAVCGIPMHQAIQAYASYHAAFPEIRAAWKEIIAKCKRDKELWTPLGRRLLIMGRLDSEAAFESVVAFVPQSTIGDKTKQVMRQSLHDKYWPKTNKGGDVVYEAMCQINTHDGVTTMCKPQHVKIVQSIMKKYAESPIIIKQEPVVIPAAFKVSTPDKGIHRWSSVL